MITEAEIRVKQPQVKEHVGHRKLEEARTLPQRPIREHNPTTL